MTYLELVELIKTNYSVCTFICFTFAFVPDYTKDLLSVFSEQTTSTTPIIWIANWTERSQLRKNNTQLTLTQNGERLENNVLCHATVFGIEQFPIERIYITSTQNCSYCIFSKKKTIPWLPDDTAFISSGLLSLDIVVFKISIHVAITRAFRIETSISSS